MSLQQDIIKINGTKVFINPFLYSRKFDDKTKKWLREFGQISKSIIHKNRRKFFPEINWDTLGESEKLVKDYTIEFFLKTMDLIRTFHSNLSHEQLLEVEEQLIYYKKIPFQKWSRKYIIKKERLFLKEKNKLQREDSLVNWQKWLSLKETQKLLMPIFGMIILSALIGWFAGISKNSCNPYFESFDSNQS